MNQVEKHKLAKKCAAHKFTLQCNNVATGNQDLLDYSGKKYRIMGRAHTTKHVDTLDFEFDYLVLVNLDNSGKCTGMWKMTVNQSRTIFVDRPDFKKYQATQTKFKNNSCKIS